MLTFKWFNAPQAADLRIPEFEREYHYIKTVAVSVFNTREQTSWHFGPLRLTFRVLCNLEPVDSRDVNIEVDDKVHYWVDDPLFIFDDTFFHRSTNNVDAVRCCLFMDIVRPNHFQSVFDRALDVVSFLSGSMKTLFYKNWSFIR
jgi:beta-hydroxylase